MLGKPTVTTVNLKNTSILFKQLTELWGSFLSVCFINPNLSFVIHIIDQFPNFKNVFLWFSASGIHFSMIEEKFQINNRVLVIKNLLCTKHLLSTRIILNTVHVLFYSIITIVLSEINRNVLFFSVFTNRKTEITRK